MQPQTDTLVPQTLAEVAANRVRLSGYYSALAARMLAQTAPDEFDAEQVGVDPSGQGVFVMFWRPPRRAEA